MSDCKKTCKNCQDGNGCKQNEKAAELKMLKRNLELLRHGGAPSNAALEQELENRILSLQK
jgi:hypothetical protein